MISAGLLIPVVDSGNHLKWRRISFVGVSVWTRASLNMNNLFELWEGTLLPMALAVIVWGGARALNGVSLYEPKFFPELSGLSPKVGRALIESAEVLGRGNWRVYAPDAVFFLLMLVSFFALEAIGWKLGIDSSAWWAGVVLCMAVLVCRSLASRIGPIFLRPYLQQVLKSPAHSGQATAGAPPVT